MLHVMVSLDLGKAEGKRDDFNKLLADKKWSKLSNVDTVWNLRFINLEQSGSEQAKKHITDTLLDAAEKLKLDQISIVAHIGNAKSIGHQIVRKHGICVGSDFDPFQ